MGFPDGLVGKESARKAGGTVPGASVRNSARGKGHEEGGLAYAKARSSLRSPPGNSWQMGKQWQTLFWGVPKSLQMVTVAMKLKDTYPLEGML